MTINIFDIASQGNSIESRLQTSGLSNKDLASAKEAAESFEAFFTSRMLESMFDGVSTDGLFGGGQAEKIYRSLLLDEYGKEMAKVGTIGVKDYVLQAVLQMQEEATTGVAQG
jgi:Rod binding domain-containing protein